MLLDRIILCDQTSERLEKYHIPHGVLQSGHWRYRPYENIQVCSAQTLEKRGSFPGLNLLIVDECHTTRQQTVDFIKNNPDVRVIGLTATPFTKGLGNIYDNVVNTVTTKELVDQKVLMPLRVFIAKEIDMTGAKKVAGEWSQAEASKRGMQITGNIVEEWIRKTNEIFGGPRKTIVFCSGVEHGADLAAQFASEGYNFVSVSYRDDDQFKRDVIEDFARPDTEIHGLIATDILTKGFDVPDVMIGVSARPFSKSLSSHIQQMGRIMRRADNKEFAVWLDHSGN
jgi:superfamily II DNA or RNA helicase